MSLQTDLLNESTVVVMPDSTYRRQGRHIIIAQMESIVPLHSVMDPSIWGGGNSEYTWKRVQQYFSRRPEARNGLVPQHYYCEYLYDDYVVYVGCPLSNKSWFLQMAVAAGVLPVQYGDDILIVLQENYSVENVERRLWKILSNSTLTPLMRLFDIPKERVLFYENLVNREAVIGPDWPFRWREPTFLDPIQLMLVLKEYEKR